METSAQNTGEQKVSTRLLLACGAIAPLLNIVVILILGATRPGYNAWQIPDSNLELGEGGWIQIANYIVTGVLLLGFAIGLRRVLRTGRGSTWGPILLAACRREQSGSQTSRTIRTGVLHGRGRGDGIEGGSRPKRGRWWPHDLEGCYPPPIRPGIRYGSA